MQAQPSEPAEANEAPRQFLSSRVRRPDRTLASVKLALDVVRGWVEAARWHALAHEKDLETYALLPDESMRTEASMVAWRLLCVRERIEELEELQNDLEHEYLGMVTPLDLAQE